MSRSLLCAVFIAISLSTLCSAQIFPSTKMETVFDVIWLSNINTDFRTFVSDIHSQSNTIYVSGAELFTVNLADFSIHYQQDIAYQYQFLDVAVFNDTAGSQVVVGPARAIDYNQGHIGYTVPVIMDARRPDGSSISYETALSRGYSPCAITITPPPSTSSFWVSWVPSATDDSISFNVINVTLNPEGAAANVFQFNPATDMIPLRDDFFVPFSSEYKPWIFHSSNNSEVIVVDPSVGAIYKISIANPFSSSTLLGMPTGFTPREVVFNHQTNMLYLSTMGQDFNMTGTIYAFSVGNMSFVNTIQLGVNETDPKALAVSGSSLFVGLNGGPYIIKIDLNTFKVIGYVRLPHFLTQIEAAGTFYDHMVYFVTHETQGKVFRLSQTDFCATPCAEGGYCNSGVCACPSGTKLTKDGTRCYTDMGPNTRTQYVEEKSAAIAMGVLWAVTTIVAAAGWFMWFKVRKTSTPYDSL